MLRETTELAPATLNGVKGYLSAELPSRAAGPDAAGYGVALSQGLRALTDDGFQELAAAVVDSSGRVHDWTWLNVFARAGATGGSPMLAWPLEKEARLFAYPNVGRLDYARVPRVTATLTRPTVDSRGQPLAPVTANALVGGSQGSASGDGALVLVFDLPKSLRR